MLRRRSIPKDIDGVLESGSFHPDNAGSHRWTMSADIGVFHLLTNQEGNLQCVHMYVSRLRRGRDVVVTSGRKEQHTPPNISDMSNLEFRTRKNIGRRGMLFGPVPLTLRGGRAGHRYRRYRAQTPPPPELPADIGVFHLLTNQ